ncbi:CcmD family protein [Chloroflexota bacterium]
MENAGFLFAAFSIIWAFVFVYVLVLVNRQKKLKREIDLLKEAKRGEA